MRNLLNVQEIEIKDDLDYDYSDDEQTQDEIHKAKKQWLKIGFVFLIFDIIAILYLIKR